MLSGAAVGQICSLVSAGAGGELYASSHTKSAIVAALTTSQTLCFFLKEMRWVIPVLATLSTSRFEQRSGSTMAWERFEQLLYLRQ